jgi:hypothetical protein
MRLITSRQGNEGSPENREGRDADASLYQKQSRLRWGKVPEKKAASV